METILINNLSDLNIGDLIRHKSGGDSYVVVGNYGSFVTAIKEKNVMNPTEWVKINITN